MAIVLVVAVIVVGGGNSMQSKGGGKSQPHPTSGVYPVKFSGWGEKPVPQPTVSYPIRFPSAGGAR